MSQFRKAFFIFASFLRNHINSNFAPPILSSETTSALSIYHVNGHLGKGIHGNVKIWVAWSFLMRYLRVRMALCVNQLYLKAQVCFINDKNFDQIRKLGMESRLILMLNAPETQPANS